MSLYAVMKTEIEKLASDTAGGENPLFVHYKDDFYRIDRDEIQEDAQSGDIYIWAIKGCGCGTYLTRCNGSMAAHLVSAMSPANLFYRIDVTGVDEGRIKRLPDKDAALEVARIIQEPAGRRPRREPFYVQLDRLLGYDNKNSPLRHHAMRSEFMPLPGDKSMLRLSFASQGQDVRIDVLRTQVSAEGSFKRQATYLVTVTPMYWLQHDPSAPLYLSVEGLTGGTAKVCVASRRLYAAAERKLASAKLEQTLSL